MVHRNIKAEAKNRHENFDSAAARALKPGTWLTFTAYPGLRLTRHGGRRTWAYRYRSPIDDRVRQIRLGPSWPATSWEKAVARWEELNRLRDDGVDPQLDRRARRAKAREEAAAGRAKAKRNAVSVKRVCELYLEEHVAKACAAKAAYDAKQMLTSRVLPVLGDGPATSIDRADAADFLAGLKIEVPALARLLRSRLGAAWDHAIDRRLLPTDQVNPWRGVLKGKLPAKSRTRYLDDAEIATFLGRLPGLPAELANLGIERGDEVRDALHLALLTAARTGEIVGLDWKAVDLRSGRWTLAATKTGNSRTVRLPTQAIAIMRARGRGFSIDQEELATALRAVRSFGLRAFVPHDLRRTVRTGLARLKVRSEVCEAALGHVEGGVKSTYNLHEYEEEVGEALQKWCDHLEALQAPQIIAMKKAGSRRR